MSSPTNQRLYPTSAGSGSSLLARTAAVAAAAASNSNSPLSSSSSSSTAPTTGSATATASHDTPPTLSRHQHTGAYLDALFPPSRRIPASNLPSPLVSPLGTSFSSSSNYKPQKPSSLASSASATGSEGPHDSPQHSEEGSDDDNQAQSSAEPTTKSISSPSEPFQPSVADPVQGVFAILDDTILDEEDKIDNVRTRLGQMLEEHEGVKPSPFRLDSIVLDVMHRHREDLNPTGAVFPSSPIRRPGSVRSFSSSANHRPWTPSSKTPLSASGSETFTGSAHLGGVQLSSSPSAGPAGSTIGPSSSAINAPSHSVGVIGSGSPRASPRPWNDSSAPAGGSSLLSSPNPSGNPWSSMLTGPPTPSSSFSYSFNPFGGGNSSSSTTATVASTSTNTTAPGSPFSSVPSGLSAANATGLSTFSRPESPSPLHSPRLNVAAAAFKPRTASTSSHTSNASVIRPSLLSTPSSSRRSSSQAIMSKNHPTGLDDEDEDDEFSPFATASSVRRSAAMEPASASAGSSGFAFPDDDSSAAMSPFAVLSSVLAPGGSDAAATSQEDSSTSSNSSDWTPDQIEEALASHGYDVDATLASIFESGGKPGQWQRRSPETTAATPVRIQAPSSTTRSTGAAGVSLMPRETFASFRGAKGGSAAAAIGGHGLSSSPSYLNAGTSTPPLRGSSSQGLQSPVPGSQALAGGGGGGAGPGRVCRYFLSGDCRRADCRFSHDLSKALCKFWLRGMCLNDPCPFLHDEELVRGLVGGVAAASLHGGGSTPPVHTPGGRPSQDLNRDPFDAAAMGSPSFNSGSSGAPGDFPELPPSGPRAQREKQQQQRLAADKFPPPGTPTGPAASDPTRNRWANALQKKATNPMSVVQAASSQASNGGSDVGLISINARNAPQSRVVPSGPRAGTTQPTAPSSRGSVRIALRPPTLLPTLSVGKSVSQAYAAHRSRSSPALQSLLTQRNLLLSRASEAFRKMDGAGARKYSSEANALNVRIRQEEDGDGTDPAREMLRDRHAELSLRLREASGSDGGGWGSSANASTSEPGTRGLRGQLCAPTGGLGVCLGVARRDGLPAQYATSSVEERTEWFLDCHGLHVHEALEIVEEFLLTLESSYPSHRGLTYLGVGVGGGNSTEDASVQKRSPKLASAVKGFLASWGYPYSEADGVIAVDHLTHAM